MFRGFLSLSAGVLALLCVTGMPGQLYARGARGGFRPGATPQVRQIRPGFDRRFMDPRFGGFSPGFGGFSPGFGGFSPGFGGFSPGFDPRFMFPR